jgi:hypothetical protein
MELVRGVKITDYCDQKNLSTSERLKLFIQVCQSIQHAHQKGIIHRDIKPSNILVTVNDGVAVPKVIDFGIAKATAGQQLTNQTIFTAFEQFIGTPAYMSPEQAELTSVDIDTRSDIYSLGVLLYELLTGKTPFDPNELMAAGLDEMRRTIRDKEPPRPSTRLGTLPGEELSTTAQRRSLEAPKLISLLRGDLDWIAMKCLEKDRARRYETANGLAMDIQRHLSQEPVIARPPSASYRLQKLIRRNKLAFGAAAAVAIALAAGAVLSTWQAVRATHAGSAARHSAEQALEAEQKELEQHRRAQSEARRAQETSIALKIQRAEDLFSSDESSAALAQLAQVLRQNPTNRVAAMRLVSALMQRNFPLPTVESLKHDGAVNYAEFSPDGKWLATASADQTARVWDVRTGQPVTPPLQHKGGVFCARFSADGRRLVTGSLDKCARIWDARDGRLLAGPLRNRGVVPTARFSPDGRQLLTIAANDPARVWDATTGKLLYELPSVVSHK